MTWSYSGDPSNSDKDKVRFLIGATDTNDQLLQDEEINYLLSENPSPNRAAVEAARSIAAKLSRESDYKIGDESEDASQKEEQYHKLADRLERKANQTAVSAYAGGLSISEKEKFEEDADAVKPSFKRDLHDHQYNTDYHNFDEDGC